MIKKKRDLNTHKSETNIIIIIKKEIILIFDSNKYDWFPHKNIKLLIIFEKNMIDFLIKKSKC